MKRTALWIFSLFAVLAMTFGAALSLAGCAWFQKHEGQLALDVGRLTVCVLEKEMLGLEPVDIAKACEGMAVNDVLQILAANKASVAFHSAAGCANQDAGAPYRAPSPIDAGYCRTCGAPDAKQ
jgi:hypothetical protein